MTTFKFISTCLLEVRAANEFFTNLSKHSILLLQTISLQTSGMDNIPSLENFCVSITLNFHGPTNIFGIFSVYVLFIFTQV